MDGNEAFSILQKHNRGVMRKVFIDGSAGTTGLRIRERLSERKDVEMIPIPEESRKDEKSRREAINSADVVFLCLPDDAAREAVALCENPETVIIDTSTSHRTDPEWTYGFPELKDYRNKIRASKRIANPGCHASGFLSLIAPLAEMGAIGKNTGLSCFSLTGYSGGGKKMIAEYDGNRLDAPYCSGRLYGLTQNHKHLPEMKAIAGLTREPVFAPVVVPSYSGMEVIIPISVADVGCSKNEVLRIYDEYYGSNGDKRGNCGIVRFVSNMDGFVSDKPGFLPSAALGGRDDMLVGVVGNDERFLLVALFDNLGKGASGAAIQNMNIVIGASESEGLVIC
ncbi:MAG TPA: N-acetyl-gamma-glutamyl-phosphate reductase [Spirochaetaceae bacterium]|nr:N-acetyl-gamma-glutamyl-phosphate reductase [Spirochaetaceae bacterium]